MKHTILLAAALFFLATHAPCQSSAEPKELLDLRASFEKARFAALSPLERKYVDALNGLKDRLTKKGDLNGALAVQTELSRMQPPPAAPKVEDGKLRLSKFKTVEEFTAWLMTTTWKGPTGNTLRFPAKDSMELTTPTGAKSFYVLSINKVGEMSWEWSNKKKDEYRVSPDLKSATGTVTGLLQRLEP